MTTSDMYAVYGVYTNYMEGPANIQTMLSADLPYTNLSLLLPYSAEMAACGPDWMKTAYLNSERPPHSGEVVALGPLSSALSSGRTLYEVLAELGLPKTQAYNYAGALMNGQPLLALYCSNLREAAVLESAMQDSGAAMTMVNEETESYYANEDQNPHYYRESDLLKGYESSGTKGYRRGSRTIGGAA